MAVETDDSSEPKTKSISLRKSWKWILAAIVAILAIILAAKRRGRAPYIPSTETATPQPDVIPIVTDMINKSNQSSAKLIAQSNETTVKAIDTSNRNIFSVVSNLVNSRNIETRVDSVEISRSVSNPITRSIKYWIDDDKNAGYVDRMVTTTNEIERGILAAKDRYYAAENTGDKLALDTARAEANRWRSLAAQRGITLSDWAR